MNFITHFDKSAFEANAKIRERLGLNLSQYLEHKRRNHQAAIWTKYRQKFERLSGQGEELLPSFSGLKMVRPDGPAQDDDWGNWKWHLRNKLSLRKSSSEDDLAVISETLNLSPLETQALRYAVFEGVSEKTEKGEVTRYFDFSMLPMNLFLPENVRSYFLPASDYGGQQSDNGRDPYGLVNGSVGNGAADKSSVIVFEEDQPLLIGSQKFPHTLLLNVDLYCPIGCADCYKARLGTREQVFERDKKNSRSLAPIYQSPKGDLVPPTQQKKSDLIDRVSNWLVETDRGRGVYDIILSGGEPLMLPDEQIEAILMKLASCSQIQTIRICTGALFMGLAPRITKKFCDMLASVVSETGVRLTLHAHIISHHQITPEAVEAVLKLRNRGISVYSQTPVKEYINFNADDISQTVDEFAKMYRGLVACGVDPYMMIADMHPTTSKQYVPFERIVTMWGRLVESHKYPGTERPRTLSILYKGGNIILSGSSLLAACKEVDVSKELVRYRFPVIGPDINNNPKICEWHIYEEPLSKYNSNPDSLTVLRRSLSCI